MLLSHKTSIKVSQDYANIIGHMCYAAYKLWNICNYERYHYKELGIENCPDWYYQKKVHKEDLWFKQLPSQSAQEVCKQLDKAWRSFFTLKRTGGIENPRPPRFKQEGISIVYMQNAVVHEKGNGRVRLSLPKQLKIYMEERYGIHARFLYLENAIFRNMDHIKQIRIAPPQNGVCETIVVYEREDTELKPDNGHYLSIDLGLHNLMTCYDLGNGSSFILGRKYLSLCHYYHKEIARVQSQWYSQQARQGIRYPKTSGHIRRLHRKKRHAVKDYLHKITRYIVGYCREKEITCVILGDIHNIRQGKDLGRKVNQKLHELPYEKLTGMLEYKLRLYGIRLVKQEESYTSQCSPLSREVSRSCAEPSNRKKRGLYCDEAGNYNADAVGAFNIMRKYLCVIKSKREVSVTGLKDPKIIKVAV